MGERREIGPGLVGRELIAANVQGRCLLQPRVNCAACVRSRDRSAGWRSRRRLGLALFAEPLCLLDTDDLVVDRWVMALLVPGSVASVAEDDHVRARTMSPVTLGTNNARLLLS